MWKSIRFLILLASFIAFSTTPHAEAAINVPPCTPFPIASVSGNNENVPTLAHDPGRQRFLVAYANLSTVSVINAVCLNKEGGIIASYVLGNGSNPDAVYDPSKDAYIVVFEDNGTIKGSRISGTCCQNVGCSSPPFTISGDRPGWEAVPAIAYNENSAHEDFLIVWYEDENQSNRFAVWGRRMVGTTVKGGSFAISNPSNSWNFEPDVAYNLNMNEFMVVYTRDSSKGAIATARDVYGRRLWNDANSTGGLLAEETIDASGGSQDEPAVAAYRLNQITPYLVVFRDHWNDAAGDVRGYLVTKQGLPHTLVNIATTPNVPEGAPKIHSYEPQNGYAVLWHETIGGVEDNERWRKVDPLGVTGTPGYLNPSSGINRQGDIINSFPSPIGVWVTYNGHDEDVYGRFLYDAVYLPAVMRRS